MNKHETETQQPVCPERKPLGHEVPSWVEDGAVYFITINCVPRGVNQLATPKIADAIEASILHRQSMAQWWIHLLVIMPDHLHGLISFGRNVSMRRVVSDWKRYLATQHDIAWQRDFFDHRIRNDASLHEKWLYIYLNPVRKELVSKPEEWPYRWQSGAAQQGGRAVSPKPPHNLRSNACDALGERALPHS